MESKAVKIVFITVSIQICIEFPFKILLFVVPEVPAEKLKTASSDYGLFLVLNSAVEGMI